MVREGGEAQLLLSFGSLPSSQVIVSFYCLLLASSKAFQKAYKAMKAATLAAASDLMLWKMWLCKLLCTAGMSHFREDKPIFDF